MAGKTVELIIPEQFKELAQPSKPWRHYGYYGGRSSGKSTTISLLLLVKAMEKPLRILCCREIQNTIADSVHKLMSDLISHYEFGGWTVTENTIRYRNGSQIIFKGVHNNTQSIKSTEGIDICFVEEAQSISQESIDVLIPTIRKEGSFFVWCWNPLTEHDAVWDTIASKPDDRTYVKMVNSEDIEELLSPEIIHEREKMKVDNPDMYAHVWLGQPLTSKTGTVFGKQIAQAEIEGRIGSVPYDASAGTYTAIDLGIGDSTAIWWFQMVGQEIHFIDHYESSGEELGHYISIIKNKPYNYTTHFLPHDAKQRELQTGMTRVEFFENNGIHNVEVLRPTNFTLGQDDINMIARPKFSKIWIDRDKCERGLKCLRAYHYEYDEKNKLLKDKPEHDWSSHSSSAFIYALIAAQESTEAQQVNVQFKTFVPKEFRKKKDDDWF